MASGDATVLLPILRVVVAAGWAPLLASDRLRALVGRWPTDRVAPNYPIFVTLVVGVHELLFLAVGIRFPAGSPVLPAWAFGSTMLVAAAAWLVVAVLVPATHGLELPEHPGAAPPRRRLVRGEGERRVRGAGALVVRAVVPRVNRLQGVGGRGPFGYILWLRRVNVDILQRRHRSRVRSDRAVHESRSRVGQPAVPRWLRCWRNRRALLGSPAPTGMHRPAGFVAVGAATRADRA
jgi:hypothetical protein